MKTKKFKIGIAGCGIIADIQAQAIQKSSNSELYSLFSRTEENVKKCGEKFDVKWSTNWDEFISDDASDPIIVKKYERPIEDKIISMYAKGMPTRDIQSHVTELYGIDISPILVSNITNSGIRDRLKKFIQ